MSDQLQPPQPAAGRLRRDQGRHRELHPLAVDPADETRHPGQRGDACPNLDAADPGQLSGQEGRPAWRSGADAARCRRDEVAPSYIFLASCDASYMSGQVLHPNGGMVVDG